VLPGRRAGAPPPPQDRLYRDADQGATAQPGRIPPPLAAYARDAVKRLVAASGAVERALGETLSEPKPGVVFERGAEAWRGEGGLRLDRRSRMMYDARHVYFNGEAYRAAGRDARLMRRLADARRLAPAEAAGLSDEARELVAQWAEAGWLHEEEGA
jgi:50S ribosomal protein L16 3-hydroxylase